MCYDSNEPLFYGTMTSITEAECITIQYNQLEENELEYIQDILRVNLCYIKDHLLN